MKLFRTINAAALLGIAFLFMACGSDDSITLGDWVEGSTLNGDARSNAVSFTIGDKGYIISGFDGDDYLNDTWEYDSTGDFWVQKADFPGTARSGAVGFALNGKGYFGTGWDGENRLSDFWEYDPVADSWTQIADFGGTARRNALAFSISGKGYVGTGTDGSEQKDFWEYDPNTNTWTENVGFGGEKRQSGAVFVINNVAYVGTGVQNGQIQSDFFSFDGTTWTRLEDLEDFSDNNDIFLSNSVGFSLEGKGYFATGLNGAVVNSCFEYTPSSDSWEEVPGFEGVSRQDASAFTFENSAQVLLGRSSNFYFDDIYEFLPNVESDR